MSKLWQRHKKFGYYDDKLGFGLDVSRVDFSETLFEDAKDLLLRADSAMDSLEAGGGANPDENRMVGHYWLRDSKLAPNAEIEASIENTKDEVHSFTRKVLGGEICNEKSEKFLYALIVGIGGSALGPQLVVDALQKNDCGLKLFFSDNTDPDGFTRILSEIPDLSRTICIVISKSGQTPETKNGMIVAQHAWTNSGLDSKASFIAITGEGSELWNRAKSEGWLACFPMWDWVGGRTSLWSAVGLLPASLAGIDIDSLLKGAADFDRASRGADPRNNPALLFALMWLQAGGGKGEKNMVVLPYRDRLLLLSRYLQQLIMESLGKEVDLDGQIVNQGIAVFGNKGSTDQHALVQQLREGVASFFAVFVEVLSDSTSFAKVPGLEIETMEMDPGVTCGDYLNGFYLGTRSALYEKGRESISITVDELNEYSLGEILALFERAVSYYASFVNINAYNQPGVEAGKKAAASVLDLQDQIVSFLRKSDQANSAEEIALGIGLAEEVETVFKILRRLQLNKRVEVKVGSSVWENKYFSNTNAV